MTSTQSQRGSADLASRRGPGGPMAPRASRDENTNRTFRRLVEYIRPWRAQVGLAAVLVVVSSISGLLAPWLQGRAIDEFISVGDRSGLQQILLALVVTYLIAWGSAVVYSRLIASIAQKVMLDIREELARKLQSLSTRFFDRNRTGDLMSRVTNDVDAVDQLLSQNLLTIFWAIVQITSLLVIMVLLDWRLTLAVLIPVPISMGIVQKLGKMSGPRFGAYQRTIGQLNAAAEERLTGQRAVISLNRQAQAEAELEPAALRELMGAIDRAIAELGDIKLRCIQEEEANRTTHRATSPLLGRRQNGGGRRRATRRSQVTTYRTTRTFIDRSIADLRQVQSSMRPTEIDLRDHVVDASPATPETPAQTNEALPPPPARLLDEGERRPPTDHERAMLDWLAASLHEAIANRSRADWPDIGNQLLDGYGEARHGLDRGHDELQSHLLRSTHALIRQDQAATVSELTSAYVAIRALSAHVAQRA